MKAIKVNLIYRREFIIAARHLGLQFEELYKIKSNVYCYFRIKHFDQNDLFQLGMLCRELVPED